MTRVIPFFNGTVLRIDGGLPSVGIGRVWSGARAAPGFGEREDKAGPTGCAGFFAMRAASDGLKWEKPPWGSWSSRVACEQYRGTLSCRSRSCPARASYPIRKSRSAARFNSSMRHAMGVPAIPRFWRWAFSPVAFTGPIARKPRGPCFRDVGSDEITDCIT